MQAEAIWFDAMHNDCEGFEAGAYSKYTSDMDTDFACIAETDSGQDSDETQGIA